MLAPPPFVQDEFSHDWKQWLHEVYKWIKGDGMGSNYSLDVARGKITGVSSVNKFGRSTNVDAAIDTDVHDGANATDDLDIWVAPTQARTHQVVSTSASDDGDPVGVGARTVQLYGLTSWDAAETSEVITLNGTTNVATTNSYVIIHRIKVLTWGATAVNVGVITATADTDGTVTAQINAGEGQTQMAIYGVPSTHTLYMDSYYATAIKASTSLAVKMSLLVNTGPDEELTNFLIKHTTGLTTEGTNALTHTFPVPFKVAGPAIIKIQANSSAANTDVSAGFGAYVVTN